MKMILGLGNPEEKYLRTRHNVGFRVLERLAGKLDAPVFTPRWQAVVSEASIADETVFLIKPQTYMNLSGEALSECLDAQPEALSLADVLIIADDVALPIGKLRCRRDGSCGGHNGLASIEAALATTAYPRLRIGVGPLTEVVSSPELIDFVLGNFTPDEEDLLDEIIPSAAEAARLWITRGLEACQTTFNGWRPKQSERHSLCDESDKMEE